MGLYKNKVNPVTGQLNLVPTATILTFKATVPTSSSLPTSGNALNDARLTTDNGHLHVWNGTQWIDQGDMVDVVASGVTNDSSVDGVTVKDALENLYGFGTPEDIRYIDDNTGDDTNGNGSFQKPYKSLQRAVADFGPNDYCTFYIYPGSYNDMTPINFPENGTIFGFGGQITNIAAPINIISNGLSQTVIFFQNVSFNNTITIDLSLSFFGVISLFGGSFNINRLDSSFALVTIQGGSSGTYRGKITFNGGAVVNAPITVESGSNVDMLNMQFVEKVILKGNSVLKTVNCSQLIPGPIVEGIIESGNTPTWYTDAISDLGYTGNVNKIYLNTSSTTQNESSVPALTVTTALNIIYNTITSISDDIKTNTLNIMLNAFRIAQIGSLSVFNMVNGFVDEYEDETGIDLALSSNQYYDSTNDCYTLIAESSTKLLLHLNGDFEDASLFGKTVTAVGDAVATGTGHFGSNGLSMNFNGYISTADSPDFAFGTGDFTIEMWIKPSQLTAQATLAGQWNEGGFYFYTTINGYLAYYDGVTETIGTIPLTTAEYQHVAVVRNSGTIKLFVNGILDGTVTDARDLTSQKFFVGSNPFSNNYGGLIDEIRVTKGIARWTANFTPESVEYTTASQNMTLISENKQAQLVPASARVVIFEEDIDVITINTDLKAFISRDDGTTWTEAVLEDEGNYITGARILSAVVDLSTQPSGSDMRYKITTANNKNLKIHGTSVSWK